MSNRSDYFADLFVSENNGLQMWSAAVAAIFSLTLMTCCCSVMVLIIWFDSRINRHATLLTCFNCVLLSCWISWLPIQVLDTFRFTTGQPIHPLICQGSIYARFMITNVGSTVLAISAVFHYRFITFKSAFPIVKEDLIFWFSVRVTVGVSLVNMLIKYHIPVENMPRAYFLCCGQEPKSESNFDGKFKWHNTFEPIILMTYMVFSVLIIYEKHKQAGLIFSTIIKIAFDTNLD